MTVTAFNVYRCLYPLRNINDVDVLTHETYKPTNFAYRMRENSQKEMVCLNYVYVTAANLLSSATNKNNQKL